MILPLVLVIVLPIDNIVIDVHSQREKNWQITETIPLQNNYQYTTGNIYQDPYSYIKEQNADILYNQISKELLQEEEDRR